MDEQIMRAQTNAIGSIGGVGLSNKLAQAQCQAIGMPPQPDTIRSLLETAHGRLSELEHEISRLGEMLYPVRASIPSPVGAQQATAGSDPECVGLLRALCDRISQQTAHVRLISDEVRI